MTGPEDADIARNRAQPRRGPPPGRAATGWAMTRVLFAGTVAVALAATATLIGVLLLG